MQRGDVTWFTVAALAHAALFGGLSLGFLATPAPLALQPTPIEVSLTDEVGLESQAPVPSEAVPAARLSPVEAPLEEAAPVQPEQPTPDVTRPEPPKPATQPAPDARPAPPSRPNKSAPSQPATPAREKPARPTGRLDGILSGISEEKTASKATTPPARTAGPAVQSSIDAEIRRQLKRHWRSPTGADVELLRTIVELQLNRDGSLAAEPRLVRQDGVSATNRPQARLHFEHAVRAIKLAAPFQNLPPEYYDYWKRTGPAFDRRLSQ